MPTIDWNDRLARILRSRELAHERLRTHDVERGDAEELLGIELAGLGEDFCGDGDGAVDGVGDDEDVGFGAVLGDAFDQSLHDAGVDLEQVVASHAWFTCDIILSIATPIETSSLDMCELTWDASRDDHHVRTSERLLHTIVCWEVAFDLRHGGDVGEISSDAGSVDDIVEREVVDERAGFEEEGEWLL